MSFSKRQMQIIESAIMIIAEKGVQSLTTNNLARKLSITEPALYRHFANKRSIMESIITYFELRMQVAMSKLEDDKDSAGTIRAFFLAHLSIMQQNPHYSMVFFSEANFRFDDLLTSRISNMMTRSLNALQKTIQSGQQSNELVSDISALSMSRLIIGSLRLLITQWSISGMIFDLETEGEKLCADILSLIVKPHNKTNVSES